MIDKSGKIHLQAQDFRTFDGNGKLISTTSITGGMDGHVAVNPVDGTFARGGEHYSATGREPYRDPTLNIFKPDGTLLYELYNWDGPMVGLNGLRLVSDSSIRVNPSIEEPSNWISPSKALLNCERGISTFLMTPRMSVN